ncbi:MAG: protein-glutamate O-methyltransferase CheR [Robiginitomaculum sp.]|nr:protein-glutamate O-methyltransferase CheR [Robiginitomaculum sp.]MDQ7076561.1 protein-glutamate O-methyltransferase CheR [Robiginitomaculum sp.]
MNSQDFDFLVSMLKKRSGHVLSADKGYLLDSRLGPIARKENFASVEALVAAMRTRNDERLNAMVTEAMTTNETFFFRDRTPFDLFKSEVIPHLTANRRPGSKIKIWCAAASTGQEPYSLAMILREEAARMKGMASSILATDISDKVLQKAKTGLYSQFEVQRGLPVQLMVKYFEKVDDLWRIDPSLQQHITFRKYNLLDSFRALGQFDVVFCRNVLIYFDQETKSDILNRLAQCMAPDGFLFLGAAETVMGLSDAFVPVPGKRGLYVRKEKAVAKVA